jgi:hypothetical protein
MSGDIADFYVHTVQVATYQGAGANGSIYAAPVSVSGYLDGSTRLIRTTDGEQVVAQSQFYCAVADAPKFTPDSTVTLPGGRTGQVITVNQLDAPGLGLPEHTVVYLT